MSVSIDLVNRPFPANISHCVLTGAPILAPVKIGTKQKCAYICSYVSNGMYKTNRNRLRMLCFRDLI